MPHVPARQPSQATTPPPMVRAGLRERATPRVWPDELLELFCLRMSGQGMCVSGALMQHDRRYALEQLAHAHNMGDDVLRAMAVQLFRHFERHQSGVPTTH